MTNFTGLKNVTIAYPERDNVFRLSQRLYCDFTKHCLSVKPADDFAGPQHFAMPTLAPWLDNILIVDYLPRSDRFQYRHYGAMIASINGFDMTGRYVSDFDSEVGRLYDRLYRKCIAEKVLIRCEHTRVHTPVQCDWHRLLCPVRNNDDIYVVAFGIPVNIQAPALQQSRRGGL